MTNFDESFQFQHRYEEFLMWVTFKTLRIKVAGRDDDLRRNTDFLVYRLDNDMRVAARVRKAEYRNPYRRQFTVRLSRPSGADTEMQKIRQGFGDFGIYGFADPEPHNCELVQWTVYNIALLREYLDEGGRWYRRPNPDGSSYLAVFDTEEVMGAKLGFVLNAAGVELHAWPPAVSPCRVCGRTSWQADAIGPVHLCCSRLAPGASRCIACGAAAALEDGYYGWPEEAL